MPDKILFIIAACMVLQCTINAQPILPSRYDEPHRPQVHFSPPANWMNDPNGMVYHKGVYHLFYQYYPNGTKWGPMHWGHATSPDLVRWLHKPVALYPDSLGLIFSGSAVVDENNTSGFAKNGETPLVAIFTHHGEKNNPAMTNDVQVQSLAYSLDDGTTWTKYSGNPVLKNPGIPDFRDPKVMWHKATNQWIMTLATRDRVTFYSSPNLKNWKKESEFGASIGAHGGVWECPDLFPLKHNGKTWWILLVSVNPGGPNGGSATQYFLGHFDGHGFKALHQDTRWVDFGTDNYAGVTWSNTGDRKIFLGWMSNWMYADTVPTVKWRSACTLPRDLFLKDIKGQLHLAAKPVAELGAVTAKALPVASPVKNAQALTPKTLVLPATIQFKSSANADWAVHFSNDLGEKLVVGFDKKNNQYFVDRAEAGKSGFHQAFAGRQTAPRLGDGPTADITLVVDMSSLELFADDGLTVMTSLVFPTKPFSSFGMIGPGASAMGNIRYSRMSSIWP